MIEATTQPEPAHLPHLPHWPAGVPLALENNAQLLWQGLTQRAKDTPDAIGLNFLGTHCTWGQLHAQASSLAASLQALGVHPGDRVLLFMQNCPQFIIAFHAVLFAGAVVVPVNPMNKSDELEHYIRDAQSMLAIASGDIAGEMATASEQLAPNERLQRLIVFDLADALPADLPDTLPAAWRPWLLARHPRPSSATLRLHEWQDLMTSAHKLRLAPGQADDLAVLPYTSGTTGLARGCMHSHATVLHNVRAAAPWLDMRAGDTVLVVVPMFHITGLVMGMLAAVWHGCSIVLLPRWDRELAAQSTCTYQVTHWPNIPTMVMDLLASPNHAQHQLDSLRYVGGGGAAMPDAVAAELFQRFGLEYLEGYGLTETAAPTHCNPRGGAKRHCLGIPYISTRACVVDPDSLKPLPTGEVGEILVHGPQVFRGYWRQPAASAAAFVEIDGKRFFRTGDLGRIDADGYYFMADRLKRMINASGFKVWPAEVEALLHRHPAVQQACVIATRDPYRGESVKAVIVPRASHREGLSEQAIIDWAKEHMAAYKYPRSVEFVDALPLNASGKMMWRKVQAQQDTLDAQDAAATAATHTTRASFP